MFKQQEIMRLNLKQKMIKKKHKIEQNKKITKEGD